MPLAPDSDLILNETGAQTLMGYEIDVSQPDKRARVRLDIGKEHLNRHQVLHGGITSCLLDSAAGATASLSIDEKGRAPFQTISLSLHYLAPATPGIVEAIGEVQGGGRKLLYVSSELRSEDGTLIATANGVYKQVAIDSHSTKSREERL